MRSKEHYVRNLALVPALENAVLKGYSKLSVEKAQKKHKKVGVTPSNDGDLRAP